MIGVVFNEAVAAVGSMGLEKEWVSDVSLFPQK